MRTVLLPSGLEGCALIRCPPALDIRGAQPPSKTKPGGARARGVLCDNLEYDIASPGHLCKGIVMSGCVYTDMHQ